jgi:phospholipid/cholesterol/gamma-HCH transport system substrate-binding protein
MDKTRAFANSLQVGFVAFVASLLGIVAVFWVGSGKGIFEHRDFFHVLCPSTSGLVVGSKVYLSGVHVGSVHAIEFVDDLAVNKVRVTLAVDERVSKRVRHDSYVTLRSEGLLGDTSVQVTMGTVDVDALSPGSEIDFREQSLLENLAGEDITASANDVIRALVAILQNLQEGQGTIGQLLKNPRLYQDVTTLAASISTLSRDLAEISLEIKEIVRGLRSEEGIVGKLLFSPAYADELERALRGAAMFVESLAVIAQRVEAGEGTIGQLFAEKKLHDELAIASRSVSSLAASVDRVVQDAQTPGGLVHRMLTDEELARSFRETVLRLEAGAGSLAKVLALLEQGEGSLGMVLHDPSLAVSLRNVFLGVQEQGLVRDLVRRAEESGRIADLRDKHVSEAERLEASRAKAMARFRGAEAPDAPNATVPSSPTGEPVPAAARTGDEANPKP